MEIDLNKVTYARITITKIELVLLYLPLMGPSGHVLAFGLSAFCLSRFLGTRQMLMHHKACVISIKYHDSMNRTKIAYFLHFIINILILNTYFNLGKNTVLYLVCNSINGFVGVLNEIAEQPV